MNRKLKWFAALIALVPAGAALGQDAKGFTDKLPPTPDSPGTTVTWEMVAIPGGTLKGFKANKDAEPKDVAIKPFFMAKTETTWDTYEIYYNARDIADRKEATRLIEAKVRPSKPYESPTFNFGQAGFPALASTRQAAVKYCEWLSGKTGKTYRLPTSAEWEWAARGGADTLTPEQIKEMAWYADNSATDDFPDGQTHPAGKLKPNGYGLHDMFGNVAEWVLEPGEDALINPVAAGGSWKTKLEDLSPSYRQKQMKSWNVRDPQDPKSKWWLSDGKFVGFRVVVDKK
ncbi:MAG: formylglycine-generating enzyme family protein [Tepidisphaerales bacterium]